MPDDLDALRQEVLAALDDAADMRAWDAVRVAVLGKSGRLTALLKELGRAAPDERRQRGAALNQLRDALGQAIEARGQALSQAALDAKLARERVDVTLPAPSPPLGLIHPLSRSIEEMVSIFATMGFTVAEGPDIETDWHNFSALNTPAHHPARTDHDTFYLPPLEGEGVASRLLRTQTSGVQIRTMLAGKPPIRIIVPGRTYRADHDATHSPMFHQCEGLVIGPASGEGAITLAHLKGTVIAFLRAFFDLPALPIRFRASYFPFTEPSMEIDIGWNRQTGALAADAASAQDWLEVLGSGMVHPRVLANCGLDPSQWQGFAFGMGIERLTMLKHAIPDLRSLFESDLRWLRHYGSSPLSPALLHEGL